jgi:hypothetical protein
MSKKQIQYLTKKTAIQLLWSGEIISHRLFSNDEYIYIKNNSLFDEKNLELNYNEFWNYRKDTWFDDDWFVIDKSDIKNKSFCKYPGCFNQSTCGDFCYTHCKCNKGNK